MFYEKNYKGMLDSSVSGCGQILGFFVITKIEFLALKN
jgi:hypothetical protein